MDSDSWTRISTSSSRRYQIRSEAYNNSNGGGAEEFYYEAVGGGGGEEDAQPEYLCPYCGEDFDVLGLCLHFEEQHAPEAKTGVCPVCAKRVTMGLVGHLTMQHGSLLKVQRKRRFRRGGGSQSTISILRKELREGNLRSLFGGSSCLVSSSQPDPLLSSFILNPPAANEPPALRTHSSVESCDIKESAADDLPKREIQQAPLSDEDQKEKARRSEFVQGLLLSTILGDNS